MSARFTPDGVVLLRLLRSPETARELSCREWEDVLWQARVTRLGGRLWHQLRNQALPPAVRRRLSAAFVEGEYERRQMLWEIDRLQAILADFIVLKGGAYAAAGFDLALGRPAGDLDIMVPFEWLGETERKLLERGWEHVIIDEYDQRYYRRWMHELPPLRHRERATDLDLHHAIAPRSSRLRVAMAPIFSAAVPIRSGVRMLSPPDLVLHSAVHLFHDGEVAGSLRDLVDLDWLLRRFDNHEFWHALVPRAIGLGLGRPLYYGLRYARRILATPIPDAVLRASEVMRPPAPVLAFMDFAVPHALIPATSGITRLAARFSWFCLYVRSHWLRMSTLPLLGHLTRKLARRWRSRSAEARLP